MEPVSIFRGVVAVSACLLLGDPLSGQEVPEWLSKLSIHGYLSQAYAVSEEHQIFGIPTDGTTDYRDLALQFRYDEDRRNSFVVQFRHERMGESPSVVEDEVDLDWAFYQRSLSDRLTLKAGRIPLPLGIFNEAGGAAATSPFFRPPNEFYDRHYTSKTLDGVLGSASLGGPGEWSFDLDGYAGQWVLEQWSDGQRVDAEDAYGAQIWANSPWPGVRIGTGAYRCTVEPPTGTPADYLMLHGSVEADLDRWLFASEYLRGNLQTYGRYHAWYTHIGFQVTERLSLHARGSVAQLRLPINGHSLSATISEDVGVAINYAVRPSLLLKLEGHTNDGLLREDTPRNLYADPSRTRYLIASVVASF